MKNHFRYGNPTMAKWRLNGYNGDFKWLIILDGNKRGYLRISSLWKNEKMLSSRNIKKRFDRVADIRLTDVELKDLFIWMMLEILND